LAIVNTFDLFQVLDSYAALPDHLCPQAIVQRPAKWVPANRAIRQHAIPVLERPGWPLHKLRKMKQKRRLDLILIRRTSLRPAWNYGSRKQQSRQSQGAELRTTLRDLQRPGPPFPRPGRLHVEPAPLPQTSSQSVGMIHSHFAS
jgi:hypothetical protein